MIETEVGVKILYLCSDNGEEDTSDEFDQYLYECGIQR